MSKLGGRKLCVMTVLFLTVTLLLIASKVNAAEWVDFVKWTFGIYAFGNVGEHATAAIKKGTPGDI